MYSKIRYCFENASYKGRIIYQKVISIKKSVTNVLNKSQSQNNGTKYSPLNFLSPSNQLNNVSNNNNQLIYAQIGENIKKKKMHCPELKNI